MVTPGGDGTPPVREHAIAELAFARQTHPATTRALIADGLDLAHRLPRTWAIVEAGDCEPWVARKVAVLSAPCSPSRSGSSTPPSPARSPDTPPPPSWRSPAPRSSRPTPTPTAPSRNGSATNATSGSPAPTSTATATSSPAPPSATPPPSTPCSTASPTSSPPAPTTPWVRTTTTTSSARWPSAGSPAPPTSSSSSSPTPRQTPTTQSPSRTSRSRERSDQRPVWAPDHLDRLLGHLAGMSTRQLAALRPRARLFVHITDDTLRKLLTGEGTGVARVEGLGPIDARQLAEVLGATDLHLTPVLDLRCDAAWMPTSTPRPSRTTPGTRPAATATPSAPDQPPATASTTTTPPLRHRSTGSGRTTRPDRHPQLRTPAPQPPPHQDVQRPHHPRRRTRPPPLDHTPRPSPPRRPPRHHPPHPRTSRLHDRRHHRRRRALLDLTTLDTR